MYGRKGEDVNLLRYKMYSSKQGKLEARCIPPCLDSLMFHLRLASYQAHVWRKCLAVLPELPSPIGNGWQLDDSGSISIKWTSVNPAPEEVLQLMFCTCPRKCVQGKCNCIDNGLRCTDACVKQDCENFLLSEEDLDTDLDSDTSSSDEEDF